MIRPSPVLNSFQFIIPITWYYMVFSTDSIIKLPTEKCWHLRFLQHWLKNAVWKNFTKTSEEPTASIFKVDVCCRWKQLYPPNVSAIVAGYMVPISQKTVFFLLWKSFVSFILASVDFRFEIFSNDYLWHDCW
jgi:hypothetical protein